MVHCKPPSEKRTERVSPRATAWGAYKAIAASLRQRITSGEYAPGTALPSEAELTTDYGVARNTLRRALSELEGERLIVVLPGRGRVVVGQDEPHSGTPTAQPSYRQIADELRARINGGEFQPGDALPSEAELTAQYGVSRGTSRQAFLELQAAGLIDAVQGRGRFVRLPSGGDN